MGGTAWAKDQSNDRAFKKKRSELRRLNQQTDTNEQKTRNLKKELNREETKVKEFFFFFFFLQIVIQDIDKNDKREEICV